MLLARNPHDADGAVGDRRAAASSSSSPPSADRDRAASARAAGPWSTQPPTPRPGETVKTFETATDEQIRDAVAVPPRSTPPWRTVPAAERARLMHTMAGLYRDREDELAAITRLGKPLRSPVEEVRLVADIDHYYADNAEEFTQGPTPTPSDRAARPAWC
ncbi:aldehyde dehydrogenase family protein [Kocuria rhizophila]|nr:aldehyde dehydrogenase family protein [Kocuria rhizophila]